MIKICIFDLDGTLLNTLGGLTCAMNYVTAQYGIPPITREQTRAFVGDGARSLVARALSANAPARFCEGELFEEILARFNDYYAAHCFAGTEPYAGITEALEGLRARGIRLGVFSNKPARAAAGTVNYFFPSLFDLVIGAGEFPLKPDPAGARQICRALGASPDEAIYFGDTAVDMRTGRALGAKLTVGVLWGFRPASDLTEARADLLIARPAGILPLIDGMAE